MYASYRPTWVEISLDALKNNLNAFRNVLDDNIHIMAVVKADAYGHGAVEIAKEAVDFGVSYLGVAFLDEALELRQAGITAPIFVLGYTPPEGIESAAKHQITLNVFDEEVLQAAGARDTQKSPLKIHIKVDTGMGRIGLYQEQDAIAFIEKALQTPGVIVEGLFTHYANADEQDKTMTVKQHQRFERIVQHFLERGISFPYLHAGNSATAIDTPEWTNNMVRLGISIYGLYPSTEVMQERVALEPVMSLKTNIIMVKEVPPETPISYGGIYRTHKKERIGTLPIGYADGYSRMLTGKAKAIVGNHMVPVVGRICMDQCMIEVTDIPDVQLHEEVVLIGKQGDQLILADDLAQMLGTINYEIPCMISRRVPRVYIKNGESIKVMNRLMS